MEKDSLKIRTLIFHPALAPYRIDLFNALSEYLDLKVVFFRKNLESQKFNQDILESKLKCDHDFLLSGLDWKGRSVRWGISRTISSYRPDVVVSTEFSAVSLWICYLRKWLKAHTWGIAIWTGDNIHMCNHLSFHRKTARRQVLKNTNSLIVNSESIKDWYSQNNYIEKTRIFITPTIQKEDSFRKDLKAAAPLVPRDMNKFSLRGKRVILFVGRLVKIKGIDALIRAAALMGQGYPETVIMIIGDGPEKDNLLKLASQLGIKDKIIFTGRLEGKKLYAKYLIGDLFVLPSKQELFGAVVNEALLAGLPVVCSSLAGAADLIREGVNGFIFDPYDINQLANLIVKSLKTWPPSNKEKRIRPSIMPISFHKGVKGFVDAIKYTYNLKKICTSSV